MENYSQKFLEQQSTVYLNRLLHDILDSLDHPETLTGREDCDVRLILKVLRERERDIHVEKPPEFDALWAQYLEDCERDRVWIRKYERKCKIERLLKRLKFWDT